MTRGRFRNKYRKSRSSCDKRAYNMQSNFSLLRKTKKKFYSNLNTRSVIDNKKFWKTVKPLSSDKNNAKNKINLIENGSIISSDAEISEIFKNYFINIVKN